MKITIWGARGSIPAPLTPAAVREKIVSALLSIADIEKGELREELISTILEAPHLSIDRAIVLAEGSEVTITVHTDHQASLCRDGQPPIPMENGDQVHVRAGHHTVKFVRIQDPGYFYRNLTPYMYNNPSTGNSP